MELPFVSFCMTSYNQCNYAVIALEAAMKQDYPNMEIIVSDDGSTDGSVAALRKVVAMNSASAREKNVRILDSNVNAGVLTNYERLFKESRGELIIGADGDDISEPNRVSRIVEEWVKGGKKATVIFHDGWKIDCQGNVIGKVGRRSAELPLGACMAYSPRVVLEFPAGTVKGCYQDHVLGRRGALIGETLFIPDCLVRYRVGSGDSSVLMYRRGPELRSAKAREAGYRQSLIDLEHLFKAGGIDEECYVKLHDSYEASVEKNHALIHLIDGNFRERLSAYKYLYGRSVGAGVLKLPYILPRWMGDLLYGCMDTVRIFARRLLYARKGLPGEGC